MSFAHKQAQLMFNNTIIAVDISDTEKKITQGLSHRERLSNKQGMLFIVNSISYWDSSIWMKDMLFPIDIIWLDEDFVVFDIARDIHPETFPEKFHPLYPAHYVLEVCAGWADRYGVRVGAKFLNQQ